MKKIYNPTDIQQKQGEELSKKLYRTISDQAKRLDDARSCVRSIGDLFNPGLQAQRRKFCEYCERLIFSDPVLYGRKTEELLWRKTFYDVISTAKKLKKKDYTKEEISNIQAYINSGVGFYHHIISKLQCQFNIKLKNIVDFEIIFDCDNEFAEGDSKSVEWAKQSVHQCLIYLGDLSRYKIEIYPNWEHTIATRYYLQAVSYKPEYGMPHNQMGTLAMSQNNFLGATYYYMRCLACKFPFEGTSNNLLSLFEKNAKFIEQFPTVDKEADCIVELGKSETIKQFLARFLLLIDIWYYNKKVTKVYSLCHQTYKNLEECLTFSKPVASESGENQSDVDSTETESHLSYLDDQTLFKIAVICLLTIAKLRETNSPQLSTLIAFTLSIYSQIIQNITNHIQEAVLNYPLPKESRPIKGHGILKDLMSGGKKKSNTKLRRRKALKIDSDEDSDLSDTENNIDYSSSDDSFISDAEDILVGSSDEDVDIIKVSDESVNEKSVPHLVTSKNVANESDESKTKDGVIKKVQRMNVNDMLEIIAEEGSLQSIKILNDWLRLDTEVIKLCGLNTKSLIRQIVYFINLININLNQQKMIGVNLKVSEIVKKDNQIPLSEDVVLKGLDMFKDTQKDFDWEYLSRKNITSKEETVIRMVKLMSFARVLRGVEETEVTFDETLSILTCKSDNSVEENGTTATAIMEELERQEEENGSAKSVITNGETKLAGAGGQISKMKHMGQLWLAAEVRTLETRVGDKPSLSPYLVLDADTLIKYTYMVKQLVYSRKFIVLIPAAVVSALDDLKKEKLEARDAIRWLESQFHRGNRFFRAQRQYERTPIPFIKYPKRRDKDMHAYIQIVECCYFFAEQQKGASNVVTLLIGNSAVLSNGENKEFSYVGLAQSVGIAIESIASFYGKWRKSKGNR
ncbi:nonsense-mediated mRNA decay factor SMG5 [Cylas formicarius]|uniref:nonsense-mediated mRNA decay factor SMG5 n=1 Tax=Cylas formicarius TaxID=197179 RepID=UPI002958544A|nr:nonsense-mediated mRNA decay factor SMG5 [Cylas formicarius]